MLDASSTADEPSHPVRNHGHKQVQLGGQNWPKLGPIREGLYPQSLCFHRVAIFISEARRLHLEKAAFQTGKQPFSMQ